MPRMSQAQLDALQQKLIDEKPTHYPKHCYAVTTMSKLGEPRQEMDRDAYDSMARQNVVHLCWKRP